MIKAPLLMTGILLALSANAEDAMKKYYHYLPNQIANMSDEERYSNLPMAYQIGDAKTLPLINEMSMFQLDNLKYPNAFSDTENAIKLFQEDLGDEPTGVLSIGQLYQLGKREEFVTLARAQVHPITVGLSATKDEYIDGYASVQGTWTIIDDRIAFPLNKVSISCNREELRCEEKIINVQDKADYNSTLEDFGSTIFVNTEEASYRIIDWSSDEIIAKPLPGEGGCRSTTLTLNFATEEFISTTTNRNTDQPECTKWKLEQPRISKIVNGYPQFSERDKRKRDEAFKLYFSGYQTRLLAFEAKVKSLGSK